MRLLTAVALLVASHCVHADSAIFLHPDGMGANTWGTLRLREVGSPGIVCRNWRSMSDRCSMP
jgi:hypothetical protein